MRDDVFLIHPPVYQPTEPPPGIPSLVAHLRARGMDATVIDLNLDFFERLLRKSTLERCLVEVHRRFEKLDRASSLTARDLLQYLPLLQHRTLVNLPSQIEDALNAFRSECFYDFASYARSADRVVDAMSLVSATISPFNLR